MAEFEELRLTVNLVDSASVGLQRIRAEIGQLTQSAQTMTTGLATATTGLTNFASGLNNAQPKMRSLNTEMREMQRHAAETGRALGAMGTAAQQGFAGFPAIAMSLYDAAGGVRGLGEAMRSLTPVARMSTMALLGVGVGVVAVGAAVVAYGVSVFKLAKDMDQLNRTARTMGMSFGELKNAQDQAKAFGGSAEMMVRTFQGVQQAQLDLYKSNSQLRQRMVSKGVDANWIDALGGMNPTDFTNSVVKYAKSLEQQWLASGAIPSVARGEANKFLQEWGVAINMMDMPELKPPTEAAEKEAKRLAKLSQDVMEIWNPMTVKMEMIKMEALKAGLPLLKDALKFADEHINDIKSGIRAIGGEIKNIGALYAAIKTPSNYQGWWADALFGKKGESSLRDVLEWMAKKMGRDTSIPGEDAASEGDNPNAPSSTPAPSVPEKSLGERMREKLTTSPYMEQEQDNNANATSSPYNFMTQDLTDKTETNTGQMEKLTAQLEKLNNFYERIESKSGGGYGGGGASGGWGGNYDQPNAGGPAGGFRGGRRSGGGDGSGDGPPTPASSTGSTGGQGGVSKADAEKIFSGGKVDGVVPATTVGGTVAGAGAVTHNGSGRMVEPQIAQSMAYAGAMAGVRTNIAHGDEGGHSRHAAGRSAGDVDLFDTDGRKLDANIPADRAKMAAYIEAAAASGSTGIGFGGTGEKGRYMGPSRMHIGGGTPAVWGAGGHGANTPDWVRDAYNRGRDKQVSPEEQKAAIARAAGASTLPAAAVGGYPSSLLNSRTGRAPIGLGLDRGDIDRSVLNDNTKIDASGRVSVQVGGKTATEKSDKSDLFKNGSMTTMEQMPHTATTSTEGPSVDEAAKRYMANR